MQFDNVDSLPPPVRPRPVRTRLVGIKNGKVDTPVPHKTTTESDTNSDVAMQPTISLEKTVSVNKNLFWHPHPMGCIGKYPLTCLMMISVARVLCISCNLVA